MTLKKYPEVLALFAIVAICAFGSRTATRPQFRLSTVSDRISGRIEERSSVFCGRTESAVERLQARLDQAISRLHQRVEQKRLCIRGM